MHCVIIYKLKEDKDMDITWRIENLDRIKETGAVKVAHWRIEGQDGRYFDSIYGTITFDPRPEDAGFVPFDQLTEAMVVDWVKTAMRANAAKDPVWHTPEALEQRIIDGVNAKRNPKEATGLPWR